VRLLTIKKHVGASIISIGKKQYSYKEFYNMKKQYIAPAVTVYGNVESITKAEGFVPVSDSLIVNGETLGIPTDGSSDIITGTPAT